MKKNEQVIYISGHKNPDTDSIVSAIAYANLKNQVSKENFVPLRLGNLNRETSYVLERFGFEEPALMESIKPRVKDLAMDEPLCVRENLSLFEAVDLLQEEKRHTLFVTEEGKLFGLVSLQDLWRSYSDVWADEILYDAKTPIENILKVLRGEVVAGKEVRVHKRGAMRVFANAPKKTTNAIQKNDVVIVGNRREDQLECIDREVSMLILTRNAQMDPDVVKKAEEKNIMVLRTSLSTFMTARLLPQAVPIAYRMTRSDLRVFHLDQDLDELRKEFMETRFRSYPVLDGDDKVVGSISRYHLLQAQKPGLIMVDHNEANQSIDDIDYADILEVIDHHRVAAPIFNEPIFFRNEPLGATATIVAKMFFEEEIEPSKEMAGLLLSAILSDTLEFRSPTSTEEDRRIVKRLGEIAGLDPHTYAMEMFREGTKFHKEDIKSLVQGDVKTYEIKDKRCRIGQVFTMDLSTAKDLERNFQKAMEDLLKISQEDLFILMVTDILQEESLLLCVGKLKEDMQRHIDETWKDGFFLMPKLLSRKKQLLPKALSLFD